MSSNGVRWVAVLAVAVVLGGVAEARAGDKAGPGTKDLDDRIGRGVYETVKHGVTLFNGGDQAACYRLYQGALMTLVPLLEHRPELQQAVRKGLKAAEAQKTTDDKAFALRAVLDRVQDEVAPPNLWERLGGEKAVRAVVRDFLVRAAANKKVDFTREGKFKLDKKALANLEQKLVELVSLVGGGPLKYTGRDMKTAHAGMDITDAEFDALAGDLVAVLEKYKVAKKDIDELVGIIATSRKDIVERKAGAKARTLYDRLGGEDAIKAVVEDFVFRAVTNPKVNFSRKGIGKLWEPTPENMLKLKQGLVDLIGMATGGPQKYRGETMKDAHAGMAISDAEFDALGRDLVAALQKYKVAKRDIDELMGIVGKTRQDIVEKKAAPPKGKTLYERLGGEKAIQAVVDDFVTRTAANPKVNFTRKGTANEWQPTKENVLKVKQGLVALISTVTGGPPTYKGGDMKAVHAGMQISNAEFDAMAADLRASLKILNVPEAEQAELLAIFAATRKDIVEKKK